MGFEFIGYLDKESMGVDLGLLLWIFWYIKQDVYRMHWMLIEMMARFRSSFTTWSWNQQYSVHVEVVEVWICEVDRRSLKGCIEVWLHATVVKFVRSSPLRRMRMRMDGTAVKEKYRRNQRSWTRTKKSSFQIQVACFVFYSKPDSPINLFTSIFNRPLEWNSVPLDVLLSMM